MKRAFALAIALTVLLPTAAWAEDDPVTLKAAEKEYVEADKQLNVAYKALYNALQPGGKAKLQAAELAWIQFRDKQVTFAITLWPDDDALKTIRFKNLTELTRQRTQTLKDAKEFYDNY